MGVRLCHVEAIVCDQSFFTFVCMKKGINRKTYSVFDFPIHGEHNGAT